MKSISVRELRQNPTAMLRDVEAGETYTVTSHNRPVAQVIPASMDAQMLPPRRQGRSNVSALPPHTLRTGGSVPEILEDMKGEW